MFHVYRKEIDWGGKTLVLETGKIARQADGAVLATMAKQVCFVQQLPLNQQNPGRIFSRLR